MQKREKPPVEVTAERLVVPVSGCGGAGVLAPCCHGEKGGDGFARKATQWGGFERSGAGRFVPRSSAQSNFCVTKGIIEACWHPAGVRVFFDRQPGVSLCSTSGYLLSSLPDEWLCFYQELV